MDDPFISILFAEDLIDFVLLRRGLTWSTEVGVRKHRCAISKARFNIVIGYCVMDIIDAKSCTIRSCYDSLLQRGVLDVETFRMECTISTVLHFRTGYDHELYLNMCALLIGLSELYFKDGNENMVNAAAHVLAYVLNFYIYQLDFNPRNDWFNLALKAQTLRRGLVKRVADANCEAV